MSRKYKVFLSLLIAYIIFALVFSFVGPERSAIRSVIGNDGVLFLKNIDIVSSSGGHCLNSLSGGCSGPFYYVNPWSWFHLIVIALIALISYVIGTIFDTKK